MAGKGERFIRRHANSDSGECLIWPYSCRSKGYGQCWFRGRLMEAHRVMAMVAHGEPPSPFHHASHACGNRPCVNPAHIRWATASENESDKKDHGTALVGERNPCAKLKEAQVAAIRTMQLYVTDSNLAPMFGVDRKTLAAIRYNRTWRNVKPAHVTFNELKIMEAA